jgi:hypothetical protein
MSRLKHAFAMALLASVIAWTPPMSAETGRIKRKPPDAAEAERIASDIAMNDGLLQKGDIVVTDRGFFVFRGVAADGYTFEFSPVPNPVLGPKSVR